MKPTFDNSNKKTGFTIIELLTVMSIIIVLISILVPALNRVRRYASLVKQKAQFHSISVALDLFNGEYEGYPPSDREDTNPTPVPYCGAMKLAEAMVGQDLKGFNLESIFRRDGFDAASATDLYPPNPGIADPIAYSKYVNNVRARRMHLQLENANAYTLKDIYSTTHLAGTNYGVLGENDANLVLCDVYVRTMKTGNKVGMPILYYKANTSKTEHDATLIVDCVSSNNNIYNRCDNQGLVDIPLPWYDAATPYAHPMASTGSPTLLPGVNSNADIFYDKTQNKKITTDQRPYMADSYILMSAGFDGEYGTSDDIFNFGE